MNNKYERLYCENCKLIWDFYDTDHISHCTKCNKPLVLKSFDPRPKFIGGLVVIIIGLLTVLDDSIPIIWIGGLISGIYLMFNGFQQWSNLRELGPQRAEEKKHSIIKEDANHDVITCGKCSEKILVLKNQGIVKIKCPNCLSEYRVMT